MYVALRFIEENDVDEINLIQAPFFKWIPKQNASVSIPLKLLMKIVRNHQPCVCVCVRACVDSLCLVIWQLFLIICTCEWLALLLLIIFVLLITDMNIAEAQQFTVAL